MKRLLLLVCLLPALVFADSTYREGDPFLAGSIGTYAWCVDPSGDNAYCQVDAAGGILTSNANATQVAVFPAWSVVASAGIGAAYSNLTTLAAHTRMVIFDNQTDGDVAVSMDGGTSDNYHVKAGDVLSINLGSIERETAAEVDVKDGTDPSTTGNFYLYAVR